VVERTEGEEGKEDSEAKDGSEKGNGSGRRWKKRVE